VDHIPNEILAHIFELAYFSAEQPDNTLRSVILQTSSHFRRVALTTPSLWSKYHLTQGNIDKSLPVLDHDLGLSKEHTLDIHLSCFWPADVTAQVMAILLPRSPRWRHLSITTPNTDIFTYLENIPAPALESLHLSHFSSERRLSLEVHPICSGRLPNLSRLFLRNVSLDNVNIPLRQLSSLELRGYGTWPQYAALKDALGGSETLRELVLHVKPVLVFLDLQRMPNEEPINLPALRTFTVHTSEWLTHDIARLIRTFECPSIETLLVQEGSGLEPSQAHAEVLRYTSGCHPSLFVNSADILAASHCLSHEQLEKLHTLQLQKASWRFSASLQSMFRGMASLERLVLQDLNAHTALENLDVRVSHGSSELMFLIPSLRTLDLDIVRDFRFPHAASSYLSHFLRLFSLPKLEALVLRHVSKQEWEAVVETFAEHVEEYQNLNELTLVGMSDGAMTAPPDLQKKTAVDAFPKLKTLSVLRAAANMFLYHMAYPQGRDVWPELEWVAICGDTLASRPLLHRAIEKRVEEGKGLKKLFLDGHFRGNAESWEWIQERVEVELI